MSLKAQLEAIIYAAETPITLEQMIQLVKPTIVAEGVAGDGEIKSRVRSTLDELISEYGSPDRGIEIREVAGGYRMSTKPEQHEVVRAFARSLKPPIRLSLPALETLAVIAYKQPATVPEINDIRGVDSGGVIGTLLERRLITTAGRKQVIGRPILYKTTKEFLMRFGLKDVHELPSMEEFEKLVAESFQAELIPAEAAAEKDDGETPSRQSDLDSREETAEETEELSRKAEAQTAESPSDPEHIERSASAREE
jgi:segregation and condensation protein B